MRVKKPTDAATTLCGPGVPYAAVCCRMLPYAAVCCRMLTIHVGQACNLAFEERDLVELFVDMSSCDDTIEVQHGVDCIARWVPMF